MKKKVFLAVALIALMTGVLSAQTYDSESDFQVTKNGNAITITKYVGTKQQVNIPPTIQNLSVTTIGQNAFYGCTGIRSVTIPNSVTRIDNVAFNACTALNGITIPSGVIFIGMQAFNGCQSLTSVTFQGAITSGGFNTDAFLGDLRAKHLAGGAGTYTRPNGTSTTWTKTTTATAASSGDPESDFQVTKNGNGIWITGYKGSKAAVSIPPRIQNLTVTTIGQNAFYGNTSIISVTIPNGVESIEDNAFYGCTSLTSVTIPNGIYIGSSAFRGSTSLTSVTFQGTIASGEFVATAFNGLGDLRDKFYATDKAKGTPGTYTRPNGTSTTWTKK